MERKNRSNISYQEAKQVFLDTRQVTHRERKGTQWMIVHSPASRASKHRDNYEDNFEPFGNTSIITPLRERRVQGKKSVVIDLAGGGGAAARDLQTQKLITSGLTVGLTDMRSMYSKRHDDSHSLSYVEGDLFKRDTWNKIDSWLETTPEQKAAMIICRPVGGFPENASLEMYIPLLNRTWDRLSADNGVLLTQLPIRNERHMKSVREYFRKLRSPDITIEWGNSALPVAKFVKREEKPLM